MRKILWVIFATCILVDILLATWTWHEVRDYIGWVKNIPQKTDFKLRHIIQYTPQALLLGFCLEPHFASLKNRTFITILGITLIGVTTEIIQMFIPSRIPALMDVFWNFVAAFLGGVIYYTFKKYSKSSKI